MLIRITLLCYLLLYGICAHAQPGTAPNAVRKLMQVYPDYITGFESGNIIWKDGTRMPFDDGQHNKSADKLLNTPSLADQMSQTYPAGMPSPAPAKNSDPGRARYEPFFFKMYGSSPAEVRKHLTEITWCPRLVGQKVLVTTTNGIDKKVRELSAELDQHPEFRQYITNIGGTFNWRKINGTKRQSTHSFGMTIDINTRFSDYWQWDCKCTNEEAVIKYRNRIPDALVAIFEKHGFIWGGKWYHFDTMHFEYRPELL